MNRSKFLLTLALLIAGCSLIPTLDSPQRTITVGPPLPDREIVFITDLNQLGFINDDGSDYVEYPVDMSDWYRVWNALPGLSDFVTWSPDSKQDLVRYRPGSHPDPAVPSQVDLKTWNGELTRFGFWPAHYAWH